MIGWWIDGWSINLPSLSPSLSSFFPAPPLSFPSFPVFWYGIKITVFLKGKTGESRVRSRLPSALLCCRRQEGRGALSLPCPLARVLACFSCLHCNRYHSRPRPRTRRRLTQTLGTSASRDMGGKPGAWRCQVCIAKLSQGVLGVCHLSVYSATIWGPSWERMLDAPRPTATRVPEPRPSPEGERGHHCGGNV